MLIIETIYSKSSPDSCNKGAGLMQNELCEKRLEIQDGN